MRQLHATLVSECCAHRLNCRRISLGVSLACRPLRLRSCLPGVDAAAALRCCKARMTCGVVGFVRRVALDAGRPSLLKAGVRLLEAGVRSPRRPETGPMLGGRARARGVLGL